MKNSFKRSSNVNFVLLIVAAFSLTFLACEEHTIDLDQKTQNQNKKESFIVGPEGGTISALRGDVSIEIPEDALISTEKFIIEEGPEDYGNDFIIKSISVMPNTVKFKTPVSLRLKYDGQLSCGQDPCKATSLVLYHFKNDATFDKRGPSDMLWESKCYVNKMDCYLETNIYSGGVFAIGEESLGQASQQPN